MTTYDVIVLGTGGVGSASAFHLADRGARVLGLDRFSAGHDRGSSHGHTRIIRQAYFEHPDYVPLLLRSYELWSDLEQRRSETLFHRIGLIEIGPPQGTVFPAVVDCASRHNLALDQLSPNEVVERFPGFVVPDGHLAVFERDAGLLLVERCVQAHLAEAERLGAEFLHGDAVVAWQTNGNSVSVRTESQTYHAAGLVITAGPWAASMLGDVGVTFRVLRKHLHWFACEDTRYQRDCGCPTFFYETADGYFYGFPRIDRRGLKIGEHSGGTQIADPVLDDRSVDAGDRRRVTDFLASHLPGVSHRPLDHDVCYYTMTPDDHFIVDHHPNHPQVAIAAGMSGHGFKFTGVLGEALADMVLAGATRLPIEFLSLQRPTLR